MPSVITQIIKSEGLVLIEGDCTQIMPNLPAECVDSIVTDPPYFLGFMGKEWDKLSDENWHYKWATEALRLLKPGGHMLVAGIGRTHHRMMVAVEDAGFEVRDVILHVFGQGFPKSLDISKAIDKSAGAEREKVATGAPIKRMIPGADQNRTGSWIKDNGREYQPGDELPATDAAKQWSGFGTALKPAVEIWTLFRKPLGEKTVAANVLRYGTGGLNIAGCRIGTSKRVPGSISHEKPNAQVYGTYGIETGNEVGHDPNVGRWPANFVLSHSDACQDSCVEGCPVAELDAQSGVTVSIGGTGETANQSIGGRAAYQGGDNRGFFNYQDKGGASRFFLNIGPTIACSLCEEELCDPASPVQPNLGPSTPSNVSAPDHAAVTPLQEGGGSQVKGNTPVLPAEEDSPTMPATDRKDSVQNSAAGSLDASLVRIVKSAARLCNSCTTDIVQSLAAMRPGHATEPLLIRRSIIEPKLQILRRNLVWIAELWDSTDTIRITHALRMLFGYVRLAVDDDTSSEKGDPTTEYAPSFRYIPKSSKSERNKGCEHLYWQRTKSGHTQITQDEYDALDPKQRAQGSIHPTVKPLSLMRYLIRLITPPGGIVLEPFLGSGTTALAAHLEGFGCLAMEQDPTSVLISRARWKARQEAR